MKVRWKGMRREELERETQVKINNYLYRHSTQSAEATKLQLMMSHAPLIVSRPHPLPYRLQYMYKKREVLGELIM